MTYNELMEMVTEIMMSNGAISAPTSTNAKPVSTETKYVSLVCDAVGLVRFPLDKFVGIHKEKADQWGYRTKLVLLVEENGQIVSTDIDTRNSSYYNELCGYVARKVSEGCAYIDITDPYKCVSEM